jgi:hypothetical protein
MPTLTDNNYTTWKTKMEMLLIREGLWLIVGQRFLRPTPISCGMGNASSSRTRSSTADDNDAAADKWNDDAELATTTIFLNFDKRAECCVEAIRNVVELWAKLKNLYERKGFSARFYLDTYRSHIQQLRSSGATVSNEIEASVHLNGLDRGYESFIVATTQSFRQTADNDIDVD